MQEESHISPSVDTYMKPVHRIRDLFFFYSCIWEAMGSIPVGDSEFFFVPCLSQVEHFIFNIYYSSFQVINACF